MARVDDRPHKPAPYADLTGFIDAAGGVELGDAGSRRDLAAATAAVVVQAGRASGDAGASERFVELVDRVGIDTLAALWRESDPVSLPGALWALYLLRQWSQANPEQVRRLLGARRAAGARRMPRWPAWPTAATSSAVQGGADAILHGVYRGDVAVAMERAAALFQVLAAGRRDLAAGLDTHERDQELARAERNEQAGAGLTAAARRWRAGTLD